MKRKIGHSSGTDVTTVVDEASLLALEFLAHEPAQALAKLSERLAEVPSEQDAATFANWIDTTSRVLGGWWIGELQAGFGVQGRVQGLQAAHGVMGH